MASNLLENAITSAITGIIIGLVIAFSCNNKPNWDTSRELRKCHTLCNQWHGGDLNYQCVAHDLARRIDIYMEKGKLLDEVGRTIK